MDTQHDKPHNISLHLIYHKLNTSKKTLEFATCLFKLQ